MINTKRFKAGDKVRVKYIEDLRRSKFLNPSGKMDKYSSLVVTINQSFTEPAYEDCYTIHEDGGKWFWYDDMFSGRVK